VQQINAQTTETNCYGCIFCPYNVDVMSNVVCWYWNTES